MSLKAFRLTFATLLASLVLVACGGGGSSAPAPTDVAVDPGDGQVTVTWTGTPGVEYWLAYAAASSVSTDSGTPHLWASMTGLSSPYVLTGLTNDTTYSFSMNGRIDGGPGGAGSPSISTVPRAAGKAWSAGPSMGTTALRALAYILVSTTVGTTVTSTSTYLAVGDGGAMYKGTDGKTWSPITATSKPGAGVNLNAAIYTLSQYIVAGSGGALYTSTDLATWNTANSNTTYALNALASNGALVVAVGDHGTIRYSSDGSSWNTASTVPTSAALYGVTYSASGYWLAVGASGTLLTSTDGSVWTDRSAATGTTQTLRSVASTQLRAVTAVTPGLYSYAVVGDAGTVLTGSSTDITQWTKVANVDATADLSAVVGSASQFLAVGANGRVFASADNASWAPLSTTGSTVTTPHGLVFAQAQYVAVGDAGSNSNSH